ncbi:MAG: YlbF family regulator [Eubacteriales bacterium]|jgi:cell fate (sporulation/competence/biofilm development) regulator YlbF (YheA/YmcA/DUF963 family)
MEEILMKANELGQMIKDAPETKRMNAAEEKVNEDAQLQEQLSEFNDKRNTMMVMMQANEDDKARIDALNADIRNLYEAIMGNEAMKEYNEAKAAFDELFGRVNSIITYHITGQMPGDSCSGSCSSCGGCH